MASIEQKLTYALVDVLNEFIGKNKIQGVEIIRAAYGFIAQITGNMIDEYPDTKMLTSLITEMGMENSKSQHNLMKYALENWEKKDGD